MPKFKRTRKFLGWTARNTFDGITNRRFLVGQSNSLKSMWKRSAPTTEYLEEASKPAGPLTRFIMWLAGPICIALALYMFGSSLLVYLETGKFTALVSTFAAAIMSVFAIVYYYMLVMMLRRKLKPSNPVLKQLSKIVDTGLKMYDRTAGSGNKLPKGAGIKALRQSSPAEPGDKRS